MEKLYKKVKPYGKLVSKATYYLIEPHPLPKDWEQDRQQRFLVTLIAEGEFVTEHKSDEDEFFDKQVIAYEQPFHLVCTDPDILYCSVNEIYVWTGEYAEPDVIEVVPEPTIEDQEWLDAQLLQVEDDPIPFSQATDLLPQLPDDYEDDQYDYGLYFPF